MGGWLVAAALNGGFAVAMGAYAAHGLAGDPRVAGWVETAVRYQMWHALTLLGVAALMGRAGPRTMRLLRLSAAAFLLGIILFCGSLYVLALADWRGIAMITPVGGLILMLGWAALAGCGILYWRRPGA
jgi:uncharacterized membrane protein YgdD (TMEM256/DUF423 family)